MRGGDSQILDPIPRTLSVQYGCEEEGGMGGGGNHTISCSDQCDNGGLGM